MLHPPVWEQTQRLPQYKGTFVHLTLGQIAAMSALESLGHKGWISVQLHPLTSQLHVPHVHSFFNVKHFCLKGNSHKETETVMHTKYG